MNKLVNKVFYTIFLSFSLSVLILVTAFNIEQYVDEYNQITKSLEQVSNNGKDAVAKNETPSELTSTETKDESKPSEDFNNIKFMDSIIYTVLLDDNNIKDVINHSNNNLSEEKIKNIANKILTSNPQTISIGFLYLSDYSYSFNEKESLIIIDNSSTKTKLLNYLLVTTIIFILLEAIIYIISHKIAKWITEPVNKSFERQKEFIADASHELKTPLSVIIASAEAYENNPQEKRWLDNLKNEANRMNNLITDLLDLASTEKAETFTKQKGNLSKTIELSVLTFEGKAYEQKIKLKYNIERKIEMLYDENSIRELVEILLDNALKHSKIKKTINISLKEVSNHIEFTVTNEGDPIPPGEEEKIFERFYRVDKSRNRKENRYGLGLAIAKNIVTNHNGKITAQSENNLTTFKVQFKK